MEFLMGGSVLQSGNVTPGHLAGWVTDGVIGDLGISPFNVIASLRSVNFNETSDQPILIPAQIAAFQLTGIVVTNASISLTTAQGGFYPQSAKGGTPIVASTQAYSALTTSAGLLQATLASFGSSTRFSATNLGTILGTSLIAIWFSLTTPQGVAATADIYLVGNNLT
jgi:hypothetical protein